MNASKLQSRKQNRGKIKSAELKREVERGSTFTLAYAYEQPFMHCLYVICEQKFYARTYVKITRHCEKCLLKTLLLLFLYYQLFFRLRFLITSH